MVTLKLHARPCSPEPRDEPSPTGFVHVERGSSRAILLTPDEIDADRLYPLITVLHGAGRQDELLARAYRDEPERRQALFLIPRSLHPTWDLIACNDRWKLDAAGSPEASGSGPLRPDLDFLEYAYDLIWRRYPVDLGRQALVGYSDGASYALSYGLSNPEIFRAVMAWAAGFAVLEVDRADAPGPALPRPDVLLEYGTHDELFPFEQIALPMRERLESQGYAVEFRVDAGGRHWPPSEFQPEALDWFFGLPQRRSDQIRSSA
ncbi:MAG: alpha/beta hydrolase [Myxococcota bacterium]